jgi:hypothetical protein
MGKVIMSEWIKEAIERARFGYWEIDIMIA